MNSTARTVSFRRMTATVLLLLPTAVLAGCVVDPRPDYERAAAIIRDHTGASETYLPGGDEAAIRSAVAAMLADGLTVDEAVRIAMLNNPRLQALFCDVGVSRAEVVQAGLPPNPTFSFTEGFPQGGGMPSLTFSASQSLIELLLIPIRKKIAESQLQQSQLAVAQQAVELVGDVKRACYLLISLQKAEEITLEDLALAGRSTALAQRRFEAGEGDKLDVNLARSDELDVQRELLVLRRDRHVGQAVLAGLLGLSRGDLAWKVAGELPAPHSLPDMASLLEKAMGERLDARIAGLRIAAARAELKRQQGSVVPSVGLGFEYERADSPPNLRGPTADLTIPAWDQNQAQIAKAAVLIARQEREYEDALNAVAQDVHKAAAAARAGADIVQFYDHESLPLSDGNVQSAARAYETGLTDILRLTQAQRTLIEQRQAYVAAMREYAIAVADLEQAVGGRLGEAAAAPAPSPEAASPNP